MHFPLQLAIVGVVEGAQQLALARYTLRNANKVTKDIATACASGLDGQALKDSLTTLLKYFKLDSKKDTLSYFYDAQNYIDQAANKTGICNGAQIGTEVAPSLWPKELLGLDGAIANGVYSGIGLKQPFDKLQTYKPLDIAEAGWNIAYLYFWSCFTAMIVSLIVFLFLIRRHKADAFDYASIIFRTLIAGVGGAMLGLYANPASVENALNSPVLLPIAVIAMFLICCVDKVTSLWCNSKLKKSGEEFALEKHEEHEGHGEGHGHGHGSVHETAHDNGSSSELDETAKAARWSSHPTITEYNPHGAASPPLPSPGTPQPHAVGPHGYAPVPNPGA